MCCGRKSEGFRPRLNIFLVICESDVYDKNINHLIYLWSALEQV